MLTYFDYLPVELLHLIFEYLTDCDIIWSFCNLSPYLNSILNNYNLLNLNFQSISKCRFDFICNHLFLERISSLTLSDNSQTPGQFQLFFTYFHLENFLNLHSLILLSITNDDLSRILFDLPKLKNLKNLITQCRSNQPLFIGQILNQLKYLEYLSISYGDIFDHNISLPLYNLKILNAGMCNFLELCRLQFIVPSLISLKINLQSNFQLKLLENSKIWSLLERLDLTLNGKTKKQLIEEKCFFGFLDKTTTIKFNEIQQFLSYFHNLNTLTLNIRGLSNNLADGNRWETCSTINNLRKFHFLIEFIDTPINPNQIFNSFSSLFWKQIKKWYVVITTHHIYTISCFNDELLESSISPPLSTSPNNNWFYSKIKQIQIDKNSSSLINLDQFSNLKKIDFLDEHITLSINQYSHIRHLSFHQPISHEILNDILINNPNIDHLTFLQNNFSQLLYPIKTIHYLHLQDSIKLLNPIQIKELSRIFPSIKQLTIHLNSIKSLCQIIDNFHRLENGIFHLHKLLKPITYEWLKEKTRLNNDSYSFTYRNESNRFLIWISNSSIPIVPLKDKIAETFDLIPGKSTDKCLLQ